MALKMDSGANINLACQFGMSIRRMDMLELFWAQSRLVSEEGARMIEELMVLPLYVERLGQLLIGARNNSETWPLFKKRRTAETQADW